MHAVRNLVRLGAGVVSVRWSQLGFGRTSSTSTDQVTPRNLFGFKDGTNNLKAENAQALDRFVWVGRGRQRRRLAGRRVVPGHPADPDAHRALGHLHARRAGADHRPHQGRRRPARASGRSSTRSTSPRRSDGEFAVPETSHVFLANPTNSRTAILRRGYSFVDGSDGLGRLDAGLFFIAYQRDPETGLRPGAAEPAARRHERVHPAHVVRACSPARPACSGTTTGGAGRSSRADGGSRGRPGTHRSRRAGPRRQRAQISPRTEPPARPARPPCVGSPRSGHARGRGRSVWTPGSGVAARVPTGPDSEE